MSEFPIDSPRRSKPVAERFLRPLAEACGITALAALFASLLAISWRKWPDPVIDFGRELYLPWRLSHGAILYRDVDDIYGPLSQYFNSAIFTCFGPSMMHLVAANLLIFIAILATTYLLFRSAWGARAALVCVAVYIAVFGFSQFSDHGNYNYITPYSHETTHGLLACLVLVHVLIRWVKNGTASASILTGLLLGGTLVLKPEMALAAGLLIAAAIWAKYRWETPPTARALGLIALGATVPTLSFAFYFSRFMSWTDALAAASRGWLNAVTTTRFSGYELQLNFLGLDRPWPRLGYELLATFWACMVIASIAGAARLVEKIERRWLYLLTAGLCAVGLFWLSVHEITWILTGRCLPGLLLIYLAASTASLFGANNSAVDRQIRLTRWLIAVLAMGLLARMFLNARLYHYGYYQAALAAIMVPAFMIGELAEWIGAGRKGSALIVIGTLALLLPGVVALGALSYGQLMLKTVPVGTGGDRFYSSCYDQAGGFVNDVSEALRKGPRDQTLLVLPEGTMINYLARLPSPIAPYCYYAMATANGRENQIVADLKQHPPDCVVIITRPLIEFGIARYGTQTDEGRQILDWVNTHYEIDVAKGGDPLDDTQCGVKVLIPKPGE